MTPGSESLAGRKLVFVVTEDWFFVSHFLPMARAARAAGLDVAVICRVRDHRAAIVEAGARVIPLEAERSSLNPMRSGYAAGQLAAILREERPDILHCIALRSILIGGTAARMAGIRRTVFALTGFGLLGARQDLVGRGARRAIRFLVRMLAGTGTRFLFENRDDPHLLGLAPDDPRVRIVGGAGVDPKTFAPQPLPPQPPLRVAVVARMLWSKGIDIAVEAVRQARRDGAAIELTLFGAPDASNRKAIPESELAAWSDEPGITWAGFSEDVAAVWREHHVACLPSRGGEGLPRTILEAAACGRAIVTTDVPGCRDFLRDGVEGLLVPPDDAVALAAALTRLAAEPELVARFGAAARARVVDGHTEAAVAGAAVDLYRDMLAA